jgi:hypothetical protein
VNAFVTAAESIEDEAPMSAKTHSPAEDLAFMRALVEGGGSQGMAQFGEVYFVAGLLYGLQVLLQALPGFGVPPPSPPWQLAIGIGPTVVFLAFLVWSLWRHRGQSAGVAQRAIGAVFGAVGLANVALICIIGSAALRHRSLEIWLIYPCVVFVLQGAAWIVAGVVRRQAWPGLLGAAWIVMGIAMGFCVEWMPIYALIAGAALIGLMAIPGAAMMRLVRRAA